MERNQHFRKNRYYRRIPSWPTARLADASHFILQFCERKGPGDVQRRFSSCTNLDLGPWMLMMGGPFGVKQAT